MGQNIVIQLLPPAETQSTRRKNQTRSIYHEGHEGHEG